jgi:hypothetical protein
MFDNKTKQENHIAKAFLKFYLPTILGICKDIVLHVQDAEKLVKTGPKPDYYVPSIGILLEVSTLVDKELADESAKAFYIRLKIKHAISMCDLSGLCGFWAIDLPLSFRCQPDELSRIAEAIVDAIKMRRTSVSNYPTIELMKLDDGPLRIEVDGRTGEGEEACADPWIAIACNMKKIEKANQQLGTDEIAGVKNRLLLFWLDASLGLPEEAPKWFRQHRSELLAFSSIDEIWLYDAEENRFPLAFRKGTEYEMESDNQSILLR